MPIFKYRGYNREGMETEGVIEADGQKDAAVKIKSKGIFPREISGTITKQKLLSSKLSPLILASITRRLSTLLGSGVPLTEAIGAL